MIQELLM